MDAGKETRKRPKESYDTDSSESEDTNIKASYESRIQKVGETDHVQFASSCDRI